VLIVILVFLQNFEGRWFRHPVPVTIIGAFIAMAASLHYQPHDPVRPDPGHTDRGGRRHHHRRDSSYYIPSRECPKEATIKRCRS